MVQSFSRLEPLGSFYPGDEMRKAKLLSASVLAVLVIFFLLIYIFVFRESCLEKSSKEEDYCSEQAELYHQTNGKNHHTQKSGREDCPSALLSSTQKHDQDQILSDKFISCNRDIPVPKLPSNKEDNQYSAFLSESAIKNEIVEAPLASRIGPGLVNLGNACFMNSILQCLFYTPPLANYLLSTDHPHLHAKFCALCELKALALQMHPAATIAPQEQPCSVSPSGMFALMSYIIPHFAPHTQQDAKEYFDLLTDALETCLAITGHSDTAISHIFRGRLESSNTCPNCMHSSKTFDPFFSISLDVRVDSIVSALEEFTKLETMADELYCDMCKKAFKGVRKQLKFDYLPPILVIHVKSYVLNNDHTSLLKINRHISFSFELLVPGNQASFSLYAMVVHQGQTMNSGHYYSFVKAPNDLWYEMNDSNVHQVDPETVLAQQAYILFYQKIREKIEVN